MAENTAEGLKDATRVDSEQLPRHVDEVVRSSERIIREIRRRTRVVGAFPMPIRR